MRVARGSVTVTKLYVWILADHSFGGSTRDSDDGSILQLYYHRLSEAFAQDKLPELDKLLTSSYTACMLQCMKLTFIMSENCSK